MKERFKIISDCDTKVYLIIDDMIMEDVELIRYYMNSELQHDELFTRPLPISAKHIDKLFVDEISKFKNKLEIVSGHSDLETIIMLNGNIIDNLAMFSLLKYKILDNVEISLYTYEFNKHKNKFNIVEKSIKKLPCFII